VLHGQGRLEVSSTFDPDTIAETNVHVSGKVKATPSDTVFAALTVFH
jgi:hypothetical protein